MCLPVRGDAAPLCARGGGTPPSACAHPRAGDALTPPGVTFLLDAAAELLGTRPVHPVGAAPAATATSPAVVARCVALPLAFNGTSDAEGDDDGDDCKFRGGTRALLLDAGAGPGGWRALASTAAAAPGLLQASCPLLYMSGAAAAQLRASLMPRLLSRSV